MEVHRLANYYVRQQLRAAREILGVDELREVLKKSGLERYIENLPPQNSEREVSFDEITKFCLAIHERYGPEGSKVLRKVGRRTLEMDLEAYGWFVNLVRMIIMVFSSPRSRVYNALKRAAEAVERETGSKPRVWMEGEDLFWENPYCPYCEEASWPEPCCDLPAGMLEGLVAWVLNQPVEAVHVTEEACKAIGDNACRYRIEWEQD